MLLRVQHTVGRAIAPNPITPMLTAHTKKLEALPIRCVQLLLKRGLAHSDTTQ
jgi:hypothetical protein